MAKKTDTWIRWPFHAKVKNGARPLHRVMNSWSYDPDIVIGLAGSVTYQQLQLAYWHGVQELLVVGLDHNYFDYAAMPEHFDDRYIMTPDQHPQLAAMQADPDHGAKHKDLIDGGFEKAREVFEEDGRRIINLTENSQCDVFEKGDINDWIVDNSG